MHQQSKTKTNKDMKTKINKSQLFKMAWANIKLRAQMKHRIMRFYFRKVDGTIREAYGTLKESILPPTQGTSRKANETLQTYYDTERQEYRSFKRANLVEMCS